MTTVSTAAPRGSGRVPGTLPVAVPSPRPDYSRAAAAPPVRDALVELVVGAREAADGDRAALLLLDADGGVVPVVSAGRDQDPPRWGRPVPLAGLGPVGAALDAIGSGRAVGIDDAAACGWLPEALREAYAIASVGVAPLVARGTTLGALVVYFHDRHVFGAAELRCLGAVAAGATATVLLAVDAREDSAVRCPTGVGTGPHGDAEGHLDVLYRLAEDAAAVPDFHLVVERLAPAVRTAARAELIDVFLCDAAASRLFGTNTARGTLARLMTRWRRAPRAGVGRDAGLVVVPMLADGALVGVVRVRPLLGVEPAPAEERLLRTVADGLAQLVSRAVLRDRLAAAERELAAADERERIADDLHAALGRTHAAVRAELHALAVAAEDGDLKQRLTALDGAVSRAGAELRQATDALSFLGRRGHGLVPSLRTLVRRVRDEQRLEVTLRLVGRPVPLPPDREEALYRLAREALANVDRHARASYASVTVTFEPDRVGVDVRDNGTGLLARPAGENGLHYTLRSMQRRLADVGGGLRVSNRRPHGVTVSGWVPGG